MLLEAEIEQDISQPSVVSQRCRVKGRDLVELKIWLLTFVNTISHNLLPIAFPFLFCAALERLA
jgi:hypothetical protein